MNHAVGMDRCDCCGKEVAWRANDKGTVSYLCAWCSFQAYAKAGTKANRDMMDRMTPMEEEGAAKPAPAAAETQEAQPAAAASRKPSGLLLG